MQDKDRFVDELLDSALSHQHDAEPRAGFEGRILTHVRDASKQSSRTAFWLASSATTAAVLVFVAIYVANRSPRPAVQAPEVSKAAPLIQHKETLTAKVESAPKSGEATTTIKAMSTAHRSGKASSAIEAHHWPSQFPTPAPLTDEQQALVRYVQDTPPHVLEKPIFKAGITIQHVEIKPLEIPSVEIKPLAFGTTREEFQ